MSNVPGAEYHGYHECNLPFIIKPVLYAFWNYGNPEIKGFVRENLQVREDLWETWDLYQIWLTKRTADTFNFVYLYWWLLVYHDRV